MYNSVRFCTAFALDEYYGIDNIYMKVVQIIWQKRNLSS